VERTDLPWRTLWHVLLAAPLAVPAFVNSYGWVSLTHDVQSYRGAVLIVSMSYFPLVYLPIVAALRMMDPAHEEVARSLGYGPAASFRRVLLPGVRPALLGGALLVALHCLAEFGALQMLAFPTFTTAIFDQYGSAFSSAGANVLACLLGLACLLLVLLELRLRGGRSLSRVGEGARRPVERTRLGIWRLPALAALAGLIALALGVPIGSLVHWLLVGSSTEFPVGDLASSAATTLGLAAAAAAIATMAALPVAWLAVRYRGAASNAVERATFMAHALPGIVVGLALVTISIRYTQAIYQTVPLLLVAYAILFLPRGVVSIRASLEHAPPVLDEVARSLGSGRLKTAWRVTLPLIRPGLGAGAALVFLSVSTELTATLMLAPTGTTTLAMEFWSNSSAVKYGAAAPYALLLIVLSLPATWLLATRATGGGSRWLQ
jgi:iron(III) transport system permease protein